MFEPTPCDLVITDGRILDLEAAEGCFEDAGEVVPIADAASVLGAAEDWQASSDVARVLGPHAPGPLPSTPMVDPTEDGRVARGYRTREAVIDALYDLFAEGNLTPTLQELAARAGRTPRAIYHHFADLDAVAAALAEEQVRRHAHLFVARPVEGTLSERMDGIVAHRAELFEVIAPARRAALAAMHSAPILRERQTLLAAHLRQQLERTFEPELSARDRAARAEALELLDLHTSWETWDRLRTWQNLSVDQTRVLVTRLVAGAIRG